MKEYRIIESRPATQYWEYIVEANNEQEALDKVLEGETDAVETWVGDDDEDDMEDRDSTFEVYPVNDNDENN